MKTDDDGTFQLEWPKSDYCIFKYKICPKGFQEGFVRQDDEDTMNQNSLGGYLPDGVYDTNTEIRYCCRSDGNAFDPIVLPIDGPFYLFRYKQGCQRVRDMDVTEEYLLFDDDDKPPPSTADIGPVHPGMIFENPPRYPGGGTSSRIFYCYYHHLGSIVSSIIG
ncbi:hypothetical protein CHS0354_004251 [Potamilus streckersoni]|uniref:Apextrin C-terminal domain-containing protein n=1 Tax=Potamilus streckersoni TaxID=2493646 RepID=A0AAE0S460_9BIVA|nr:hypothetical protein CHS0354_004251 [Potamilus streckersoni]